MDLYTEEGRRAYATEAGKYGTFTLETAAQLINDNQISAEVPHIDGELLAAIEAQLAPEITAVFFVDRAFCTASTLIAAHPGMRGKDPRQFFDCLEVGVLLEKELEVGKHFLGENADRRAVIARYETRVTEANPPAFAFQYSSLVKRTIAREPDHVFRTRVHVAGAEWARFLQLESLIHSLVEYEPSAAAQILGPLASAIVPLALTAGPAHDPMAEAARNPACAPEAARNPACAPKAACEPESACAPKAACEAACSSLSAAVAAAHEAIKLADTATARVNEAVRELRLLTAAV